MLGHFLAIRSRAFASCYLLAALLMQLSPLRAEDPLHVRIDRLVEATQLAPAAGLVSDEEFARRVYLDLTGAVPTAAELKKFLTDSSPDKRRALVDLLFASPQYVRHVSTTLDVMLMERRADKHVKQDEWQKYLYDSVAQNKPWNQLAREILAADGADEKTRAAAKFYLDREGEPNLLTRDVGRMFFGMDLACCQCHDHPLVGSYEQFDYYGIYAFLSRGFLFTDKAKKVFYAEKAEGDAKYTSVFTKHQDEARPRLPGDFELDEPVYGKGQEYQVAPANGVRPVPKYSRRARLAELVSSGENRQFNRNIVNRLWSLLMGRGLVEPLDMHHADNPASNPELLEMLADEFVKLNFDIKAFLREIALTKVYQRSVRSPAAIDPAAQAAAQQLASLEAQQQQAAQALAKTSEAFEKARGEYDVIRKELASGLAELAKSNEAVAAAEKAAQETSKTLTDAQQQLTAKKDVATAVQDAANKASEAAGKLPEEKELAQAAEKFKARAAQLATELAAAEKLVNDRTPAAKSAADALAAAQSVRTAANERLEATRAKISTHQQQLRGMQEQIRTQQVAQQASRMRVDEARVLVELGKLIASADGARKQLAELDAQLAAGKQTLATVRSQLPQMETAATAAKTMAEQAAAQAAEFKSQLAGKQQAVQLLTETAAKAEVAAQKLPQDGELKQATEALKARQAQLAAEFTELQKGFAEREQAAKLASEQLAAAQQAFDSARSQLDSLQKSIPTLEAELAAAHEKLTAEEMAARAAREKANEEWNERFLVAPLEPLTPEQLAWSILKVTGVVEQHRKAGEAEANKSIPLNAEMPADPAKLAEREKLIEQYVYGKLKGQVTAFVKLFGHEGGQPQRDFFATVDQALFFANGGVLQSWLNPNGDNLVGHVNKLTEPKLIADELYLSVLSRRPSEEETTAVADYLANRANDRGVAIQEIAWALITSTEFRFQ